MSKPIVLVTGANGQLGSELRAAAAQYTSFEFLFPGRDELSITDSHSLHEFFLVHKPDFCINCAAYTAVDKAESEQEKAFETNAYAAGELAKICAQTKTRFIHISTDYVFDGQSPEPYTEEDNTSPINVYGASKLKGEELCKKNNPDSIIIRTAWVYSSFGHNFVKTMLRLMKEKNSINVVNDQVGAPTYAADLAAAILCIISSNSWRPGIYHYSNKGKISWYEFAVAIKELSGSSCLVHPIPSSQYPTPAKRPSFSLLNTEKIRNTFYLEIPDWKFSLAKCIELLKQPT